MVAVHCGATCRIFLTLFAVLMMHLVHHGDRRFVIVLRHQPVQGRERRFPLFSHIRLLLSVLPPRQRPCGPHDPPAAWSSMFPCPIVCAAPNYVPLRAMHRPTVFRERPHELRPESRLSATDGDNDEGLGRYRPKPSVVPPQGFEPWTR